MYGVSENLNKMIFIQIQFLSYIDYIVNDETYIETPHTMYGASDNLILILITWVEM